jgi:hypothetical protein
MAIDQTLVQIRERSFLEVHDLALVVVRNRPRALGLAALAGIAPFAALNAWLTSDPEFPLPRFALLVLLEAPWATAPLTVVLGSLMFGQRLSVGQLALRLIRALPMLIVYQLILRGFLIALVVLYPLIPARLVFLNEVILLERDRWWKAPGRCAQLCARRGGDLFAQWMAQVFVGAAFVTAFSLGIDQAASVLTTSELTWETPGWSDLYSLSFQLALWLTIAFFTVARFLTYLDHRIRKEGWEIELRLQDVGRAMEEAQAW